MEFPNAQKRIPAMDVLWADGVNPKLVMEHYGYQEKDVALTTGFWRSDAFFDNLALLPEVLKSFPKGKIRIVLDYDPDYPRAFLQVFGLSRG